MESTYGALYLKDIFESRKEHHYQVSWKAHWTQISNFLGENKFFGGDHPWIADFLIYEGLHYFKSTLPHHFQEFKNL